MAHNREKTSTQDNLLRNTTRRTHIHSNRTTQRIPIRQPASHRLPDTDNNLRSNPDRIHTLLQKERRTHPANLLPDRLVRSHTTRTSSLRIPILQLQPSRNRNQQDHTNHLQNTRLDNHRNGHEHPRLHSEKPLRRLNPCRSPGSTILRPRTVDRRP